MAQDDSFFSYLKIRVILNRHFNLRCLFLFKIIFGKKFVYWFFVCKFVLSITIKTMTKSAITKTIQKSKENEILYTLGFRRLVALPVRVRKNINFACVLKGETNDNSIKEFFNKLTEIEYINWLKSA